MDFSDDALYDHYAFESQGIGKPKPDNGYAQGKSMMDVTVAMWNEDMFITLLPSELYNDPEYCEWYWWLDRVLKISLD